MKRTLLVVAFWATAVVQAQPWATVHTFTNATYRLVGCGAQQQICLGSDFSVATSTNLLEWAEHGPVRLPASLYETEEYQVVLSPLHVAALPEGGFLMLLLKVEFPQLGNLRIGNLYSLRSSDGLEWSDVVLLAPLTETLDASFMCQVGSRLLFLCADSPSGWVTGAIQSRCRFYAYTAQSNSWSLIRESKASPGRCHLFSDDASFYYVHWLDPGAEVGGDDRTHLETSSTGLTWESLPPLDHYLSSAAAHDQLIFGAESHYTPGTGWQPTTHGSLRNIRFNGDTLVGTIGSDLVASRDFGVAWFHQSFAELDTIDVASHGEEYVALVTERRRSSESPFADTLQTFLLTTPARTARRAHVNVLQLSLSGDRLAFDGQPDVVYQVETALDPVLGPWSAFGMPVVGRSVSVRLSLLPDAHPHAFFRVFARAPASP